LTTTGKFDEAERVLNKSLEVSPASFAPNLLLGSLYVRQGRFDQAESSLLQALRFVSPTERRNLSRQFEAVGDGYMARGNSRGAERAYRKALELDGEKDILAGKIARAAEHS
jgi:Flp pilus assembly protein TadD